MKKTKEKFIPIGLFLVAFLVPTILLPYGMFEQYNLPKAILLLIAGLILLLGIFTQKQKIKFDKTDTFLFVFYALVGITTIFSINTRKSIWGESNRYEGLLTFGVYILIYFSAKYYLTYHKKILQALLIVVSLISVYTILQYYEIMPLHDWFSITYTPGFATGTFGNSNFMGAFITLFLPLAITFYLFTKEKKYLFFSSLFFFTMLVTTCRSAWVAFALYGLIGLIYIIRSKKREYYFRMFLLLSIFIVLFLITILPPISPVQKKAQTFIEETKLATNKGITDNMGAGRILIWKLCLNIVWNHPILGCGPDAIQDTIIIEQNDFTVNWIQKGHSAIDKAHNHYLQIGATMGIPALIIYLVFISSNLKLPFENVFKSKYYLLVCTVLAGYLLQDFFNISTIGVTPIFFLLLGAFQNKTVKEKISKDFKK